MKHWLFSALILIFALSSTPAMSFNGNEGANGGDDIGLEFEARYVGALQDIASQFPDLNGKIMATPLRSQLDQVQVLVVEDELYVEAAGERQISAALNDPKKMLILVNHFRLRLMTDPIVQKSLAVHEVLGLVGLESTGRYPISSNYLSRMTQIK